MSKYTKKPVKPRKPVFKPLEVKELSGAEIKESLKPKLVAHTEPKHCDDYISDYSADKCLRFFLLINRMPAVDSLLCHEMGVRPKLFADWVDPRFTPKPSRRVRVVMASRLGDVGITENLKAEQGYQLRVPVEALTNFSDKP